MAPQEKGEKGLDDETARSWGSAAPEGGGLASKFVNVCKVLRAPSSFFCFDEVLLA